MSGELERREYRDLLVELRSSFEDDDGTADAAPVDGDELDVELSGELLPLLETIEADWGAEVGIEARALVEVVSRWSSRQMRAELTA
jgi:hypothetical protein